MPQHHTKHWLDSELALMVDFRQSCILFNSLPHLFHHYFITVTKLAIWSHLAVSVSRAFHFLI